MNTGVKTNHECPTIQREDEARTLYKIGGSMDSL